VKIRYGPHAAAEGVRFANLHADGLRVVQAMKEKYGKDHGGIYGIKSRASTRREISCSIFGWQHRLGATEKNYGNRTLVD
jgi:hypothetical protein